MPTAVDLIALSLLPIWRWRAVAEQLRNGQTPDAILHAAVSQRLSRRRRNPGVDRSVVGEGTRPRGSRAWARPPVCEPLASTPTAIQHGCGRLQTLLRCFGCRASREALADPIVSIVGSRAGSTYALSVAERLAGDLAVRGITVASGLARGVDSAAHRGALAAGGITVGVLGCGADIVYPPEHATLASEIAVPSEP